MTKSANYFILLSILFNSWACNSQETISVNYLLLSDCDLKYDKTIMKYLCCKGQNAENVLDCYDPSEIEGILALTEGLKPKPKPGTGNCMPMPFKITKFNEPDKNWITNYSGDNNNPIRECPTHEGFMNRAKVVWENGADGNIKVRTFIRKNITFQLNYIVDKKVKGKFGFKQNDVSYTITAMNGKFDFSTLTKVQ